MTTHSLLKMTTVMIALVFIAACGGGGSSTPPPQAQSARVAGTASKGLIKNGVVKIYAATSTGSKGALLVSTTTDSEGHYTADVPYSGPVIIEATGNYSDEATGQTKTIDAANPLVAAIGSVSADHPVTVAVTPLTDLAYHKAVAAAAGGTAIATAIGNANTEVSNLFSVDITTTQPVDCSSSTLQNATAEQRAYTFYLAGISQLASDSNKPVDDVVNDLKAAGTAASTSVVTSVNTFLGSNTNNLTGYKRLTVTLSIAGLTTQKAGGLDFTISLPAGVLVNSGADGGLAPCEYSIASSTGTNPVAAITKYTAASGSTPAKLRMIILNTNLLSNGEVAVLQLNVPTAVQETDFTIESVVAKDQNGATISGVTLNTQ